MKMAKSKARLESIGKQGCMRAAPGRGFNYRVTGITLTGLFTVGQAFFYKEAQRWSPLSGFEPFLSLFHWTCKRESAGWTDLQPRFLGKRAFQTLASCSEYLGPFSPLLASESLGLGSNFRNQLGRSTLGLFHFWYISQILFWGISNTLERSC